MAAHSCTAIVLHTTFVDSCAVIVLRGTRWMTWEHERKRCNAGRGLYTSINTVEPISRGMPPAPFAPSRPFRAGGSLDLRNNYNSHEDCDCPSLAILDRFKRSTSKQRAPTRATLVCASSRAEPPLPPPLPYPRPAGSHTHTPSTPCTKPTAQLLVDTSLPQVTQYYSIFSVLVYAVAILVKTPVMEGNIGSGQGLWWAVTAAYVPRVGLEGSGLGVNKVGARSGRRVRAGSDWVRPANFFLKGLVSTYVNTIFSGVCRVF